MGEGRRRVSRLTSTASRRLFSLSTRWALHPLCSRKPHKHTHTPTCTHSVTHAKVAITTERYPGRHGTKDQRYQPRARWPVTAHLLESRSRHLSDMAESEPKARTASLTHREPRPPSVTTRTLSAKAVRRSSCTNCVSWEWVRLQKKIYATHNTTQYNTNRSERGDDLRV